MHFEECEEFGRDEQNGLARPYCKCGEELLAERAEWRKRKRMGQRRRTQRENGRFFERKNHQWAQWKLSFGAEGAEADAARLVLASRPEARQDFLEDRYAKFREQYQAAITGECYKGTDPGEAHYVASVALERWRAIRQSTNKAKPPKADRRRRMKKMGLLSQESRQELGREMRIEKHQKRQENLQARITRLRAELQNTNNLCASLLSGKHRREKAPATAK